MAGPGSMLSDTPNLPARPIIAWVSASRDDAKLDPWRRPRNTELPAPKRGSPYGIPTFHCAVAPMQSLPWHLPGLLVGFLVDHGRHISPVSFGPTPGKTKIGRASCRERGSLS